MKEVTSPEITDHIRGLGGRSGRNDTSGQIRVLGSGQVHASRSPILQKMSLEVLTIVGTGLTSVRSTLWVPMKEEETKDESEDGTSGIEVEEGGEDGDRENYSDEQLTTPQQGRDTVLRRNPIFISWIQLAHELICKPMFPRFERELWDEV